MSKDSNDSAFFDEIREWLNSMRFGMDQFSEQDRTELLNAFMQTVKVALSLEVPVELTDLVASMSWLAGEFAIKLTDVLPTVTEQISEGVTVTRVRRMPPPGTILLKISADKLLQRAPISTYVNYLREAVSYIDESSGKENWLNLQRSSEDYAKKYSGERVINHPAAVANRARHKIKELSGKFKTTNGEVNILCGDSISEILIRSTGYAITLHGRRTGNVQELASLAINWLIAGYITMPGPGAENMQLTQS